MLDVDSKNNTVTGVYTLSEFLGEVKKIPAHHKNVRTIEGFLRDNDGWMGLNGARLAEENHLECTSRLCRDGWPKGLDLIEAVGKDLTMPNPISIRRVPKWKVQGDDLDQQRVWQGDLDHAWRTTARDKRFGPTRVRLIINSIEFGDADEKTMRWRGAVAAKAADILAEAGYSVQVESCFKANCTSTGQLFKLSVIVKPYEVPVDLPVLAAATVLPAFFRSLGHIWGTVVSPKVRSSVSYSVENFETFDFEDSTDHALMFLLGRDIKNADSSNKALAALVKSLDDTLHGEAV